MDRKYYGPRSRKEYLEAIYVRYKKASPKEKAGILDEFCASCWYHRKHAIRFIIRSDAIRNRSTKRRVASCLPQRVHH